MRYYSTSNMYYCTGTTILYCTGKHGGRSMYSRTVPIQYWESLMIMILHGSFRSLTKKTIHVNSSRVDQFVGLASLLKGKSTLKKARAQSLCDWATYHKSTTFIKSKGSETITWQEENSKTQTDSTYKESSTRTHPKNIKSTSFCPTFAAAFCVMLGTSLLGHCLAKDIKYGGTFFSKTMVETVGGFQGHGRETGKKF
jgi:hypothetical protein